MFADRVRPLVEKLEADESLPDDVRDVLLSLLSTIADLDPLIQKSRTGTERYYTEATDNALDNLRTPLANRDSAALLAWVKAASEEIAGPIRRIATSSASPQMRQAAADLSSIGQRAASAADLAAIRGQAQTALKVVQVAADRAQEAAGITGGASLSDHFRDYAKSERRAAEVFRGLGIAAILAAVLAAVFVEHPAAGDWVGLAYRVAVLAAVGALSAYFAKQAGHHRRAYNWAKGLEVQLKSFPAFIDPADSVVKADIYKDFSRRVLGAPPEASKQGNEDTLPTAQLIEALIALAKRSS